MPPTKSNILPCQLGERNNNIGEVFDESLIITRQSEEASNIRWRSRHFPLHHRLYLGWVDQDTVLVEEVYQKLNLAQPEVTLRELGVYPLHPQNPKNLS